MIKEIGKLRIIFWHMKLTSKVRYYLFLTTGCYISSKNSTVSFWSIDLWPKTFLILYPSNENSTTEITFVCIHETQTLLKNFVLLFVLPLPFVFQTFRLVSIFVRRAVIHLQCNLYNLESTQGCKSKKKYPFLSTGQLHSPSYRHKLTIESPKLKENIAGSKKVFNFRCWGRWGSYGLPFETKRFHRCYNFGKIKSSWRIG